MQWQWSVPKPWQDAGKFDRFNDAGRGTVNGVAIFSDEAGQARIAVVRQLQSSVREYGLPRFGPPMEKFYGRPRMMQRRIT